MQPEHHYRWRTICDYRKWQASKNPRLLMKQGDAGWNDAEYALSYNSDIGVISIFEPKLFGEHPLIEFRKP